MFVLLHLLNSILLLLLLKVHLSIGRIGAAK